jgi:hypothetical protein
VRVAHDVTLLHGAVLLEESTNLLLVQTWVDAGDEEVRAWVYGVFFVLVATRGRWATTIILVSPL